MATIDLVLLMVSGVSTAIIFPIYNEDSVRVLEGLRDAVGKTRQTTTSADGSFHLTELPAGRYELIATASGFKTIEQSIQLNPSQLAMLQPVLDIGTASEQVTVEAASAAGQSRLAAADPARTGVGPTD